MEPMVTVGLQGWNARSFDDELRHIRIEPVSRHVRAEIGGVDYQGERRLMHRVTIEAVR